MAVSEPTDKRRVRSAAFARAALVLVLVVGLDQLTKHTLAAGVPPGETRNFLPAIQLVHVRNTGVAFGFFSGGGALVLIFTLVALGVLIAYFAVRPDRPWLWLPSRNVAPPVASKRISMASSKGAAAGPPATSITEARPTP